MKLKAAGTGIILSGAVLAVTLLVTAACASIPSGSPAPSTPVLTPPPSATSSATLTSSPSASPIRTPTPTPTVTTTPASTASPSGAYTISLWTSDTLGTYLVDANGMTLYFFARDSVGKSTPTGAILANWPPFFVSTVSVPSSLSAPDFAAITRDDGKKVIMYKGWPLYYYIGDKKAGDTNGQGIGGVWFVVNPSNFPPVPFPIPPAATTPPASSTVTTTPTVTPKPGQTTALTPTPTATTGQTPTSYTLNQAVTVGSTARWTVSAARSLGSTLPATMSRSGTARTTTGKFVQVNFMLENTGDTIYNTGSTTATILDSKNREFKPMGGYNDYVPQGQDFLNVDLLPNQPKSFVIIYEVPADATGLSFKVSDFAAFDSKTALINLGL